MCPPGSRKLAVRTPRSIHRSVQEVNSTLFQFLAHRVDIVHAERELEPDPGVGGRHARRLDELGCLARPQRLTSVSPNSNTVELSSSNHTGSWKTSRKKRFAASKSSTNSVIAAIAAVHVLCSAPSLYEGQNAADGLFVASGSNFVWRCDTPPCSWLLLSSSHSRRHAAAGGGSFRPAAFGSSSLDGGSRSTRRMPAP
jgi:hypothetical protein